MQLATWFREKDDRFFLPLFAKYPAVDVRNARKEPADIEQASGLLLTGGPDIAAQFHSELTGDPALIRHPEPERDAWEFHALRRALERGLPVLCICKGTQLLNVALGGTLHLDIPGHNLPELEDHNLQPLRYASGARHRFERVNSSHHQALARVADSLEVEAWCAQDDIIEQVKLRNYPWAMGVQYHPERDAAYYGALFEEFFAKVQEVR